MLTRDRFRENVIPTRRRRLPDWAAVIASPMILLMLVLGGYLVAAVRDERSDQAVEAAAALERQRIEAQPLVMQAYEAGLADGVAAVRDTPEGIPLAQACLAMRGGL